MRLMATLLLLPSLAHAGVAAGLPAEKERGVLDVLFAVREGKPTAARYLRRMLAARRPKLLACYRKARPKVGDGVWTGAVTMRRKQRMLLREARSTLGDAKMVHCVEGVLGGMILERFGIFRLTLAFVRLPVPAPAVMGSLSLGAIQGVFSKHMHEVKHCYEKALLKRTRLAGKVVINFTIGSDGRVVSASVASSSVKDREVGRCIERAISTWRFPRPAGGGSVKVSYPFILRHSF